MCSNLTFYPVLVVQDVHARLPWRAVRHQNLQVARGRPSVVGAAAIDAGRNTRVLRLSGGQVEFAQGRQAAAVPVGLCARLLRPEQPVRRAEHVAVGRARGLHIEAGHHLSDCGAQRQGLRTGDAGPMVAG